jgi:hypothetical protein
MKFDLEKFQREQKGPCPPVARADLTDKVVAVIGASAGLGFEASKHFASMNPGKLVLGVRTKEKGELSVKGSMTLINYYHKVSCVSVYRHLYDDQLQHSGDWSY